MEYRASVRTISSKKFYPSYTSIVYSVQCIECIVYSSTCLMFFTQLLVSYLADEADGDVEKAIATQVAAGLDHRTEPLNLQVHTRSVIIPITTSHHATPPLSPAFHRVTPLHQYFHRYIASRHELFHHDSHHYIASRHELLSRKKKQTIFKSKALRTRGTSSCRRFYACVLSHHATSCRSA